MIFQTSSRFAQLQKTKPSRTGDGVSVPHHRPPPLGGARGAWAPRLLQHRQGWGSRWPGALRLVPGARAHQLILFFVRCGDQGAGVFTDWITVPRLERKSMFLNVRRKPAGFTFTVLQSGQVHTGQQLLAGTKTEVARASESHRVTHAFASLSQLRSL